MLVPKFWKSWSWLVASFGLVLPEVLQVVADHSDLIPYLEPDTKNAIRLACLVAVIVVRPIQQKSLR